MAELARKIGEFPLFSINTPSKLTVFGGTTLSTDIDNIVDTPEFTDGWAYLNGTVPPPEQDFNALGYCLSYIASYYLQKGIPEWDGTDGVVGGQEYIAGKSVVTKSGNVYISILASGGADASRDPSTSPTYWSNITSSNSVLLTGDQSIDGLKEFLKNVKFDKNIGIGVTNSPWGAAYNAMDIGNCAIAKTATTSFSSVANAYLDTSGVWRYKTSSSAVLLQVSATAGFEFYYAVSGTADAAITWIDAFKLPTVSGGGLQLPNIVAPSANMISWAETASATLSSTGLTAVVTGTAYFARVGTEVVMEIPVITGTSNATTFTLTGIPSSFRPTAARPVLVAVKDNGVEKLGLGSISTAGVLTLYSSPFGSAFTASGVKAVQNLNLSYLI